MTRGVRSSLSTIMQFQKTNESLSFLHRRIKEGKLDNIVVLDDVISQLMFKRFSDPGFRRYADEVIKDANKRKQYVIGFYNSLPNAARKK